MATVHGMPRRDGLALMDPRGVPVWHPFFLPYGNPCRSPRRWA